MKRKGIAKLIAVASALVMLLSQVAVSANFVLTADIDIMRGRAQNAEDIDGFFFDSKNYAMNENGFFRNTYGQYQQDLRWWNNWINTGWNAADSQNIYPIGTAGETDYFTINSPQTFSEAPYADFGGTDVTIWNGYMFVVMEKINWTPSTDEVPYIGGDGATFESAIQVFDVANGKREHVATWDAKDLEFGGTDANLSHGIRQIAVNDEHIFMLVDMCSSNWMYRKWGSENGVTAYGCGLVVFDNPISRQDQSFDLPQRSAMQLEATPGSDREKFGVDQQWRMTAKGSGDGGDLFVRGDYLVYIPQLWMNNMAAGTNMGDDVWKGIHILKWNDPEREATTPLNFSYHTFLDWLDISFPAEYKATETQRGDAPDVGNMVIDGDYMYLDVVYTAPTGVDGAYEQYDQIYVVDISDIENPVVLGSSAPLKSLSGQWDLYRKIGYADGFVYVGYRHWFKDWAGDPYDPYLLIFDVRDKQNPFLANSIELRLYGNQHEPSNWDVPKYTFGVDGVVAVDDIVIVNMDLQTLFFEMNEDRTEIVDNFYQENIMTWGALSFSGSYQPFVYGKRIFYPQLSGTVNTPSAEGVWTEPALDTEAFIRYLNRIEVIDFTASMPMGLYVDDIENNGDDTYTISGTLQGVEVLPSFYDIPAITVNDEDGEWVSEILYGDLETEVLAESDTVLWSFTTDAEMPAKLTFVVNDSWGDMMEDDNGDPLLYENVNLDLVGVDPVFTLTGTAPEAIAAGDYTVTLNVSNLTANDYESAVVVVAVYDAQGKLVAVTSGNPEAISSGDVKDLTPVTATVPQAESYDGYTAKALLLNSVEGLAPICANLAF